MSHDHQRVPTSEDEENRRMVENDGALSDDEGVGHSMQPDDDTNSINSRGGRRGTGGQVPRIIAIIVGVLFVFVILARMMSSDNKDGMMIVPSSSLPTNIPTSPATPSTTTCPAGMIMSSDLKAPACLACPTGYYCDGQSSSTTPVRCPIGHYCPIASSKPISCGNGLTTSNDTSISELACHCELGSYRVPNDEVPCQECPENTYCPDGRRLYSCGPNAVSSKGSRDSDACSCPTGVLHCQPLPPGTPTKDGSVVKACPSGYICRPSDTKDGSTVNEECPENSFCPPGATDPIPCGSRQISPAGSSSISDCKCSPNTYAIMTESITPPQSIKECRVCVMGQICDGSAVTAPCPPGSWCPDGIHVMKCPNDKPKTPEGAYKESQCRPTSDCDDGEYKENGVCTKCPRGWYCNNGVDKTPCATGAWCPVGSRLPSLCVRLGVPDGEASPSAGQSEDGQADPCWNADIAAQPAPAMNDWSRKPMEDVIDDNTGWGDDHEDGPRLTKNAAVIRCDNMHSAGDGVSLAQFKYWTVLEQAMCSHRHWILPNWRKRYDSNEYLPWEAVWEWKNFSRGLTSEWGIAAVPPRRMENQHMRQSPFSCTPANGRLPDGGTQVAYSDFGAVGRAHYADANIIAFKYLRPAPQLQQAIADIRRGWERDAHSSRFTCLHLRIESDWVQWFNGAAKQTLEQIAQRFNASYQLAYGHTNTIPTIERPLDDSSMHARIFAPQRLFIAGEHSKEAFGRIQELFGWMFPLGIFSKATIGLDTKYAWDKKAYTNLEYSVIDREICSTAEQFIGNAFSGWSISVWGRRIYSPGHRSMGSWLANGQYNWMANPLKTGEDWSGPLNPYCPDAFIRCPHFTGPV